MNENVTHTPAALPKHDFSRNSGIWLREPDGNSYNQMASAKAVFAPHSNIWWGVNKFCRILNEPPNGFGGEHPRVKITYPNQIPFAETRYCTDNESR